MFSNKRRLGILALIIANIIWGFASPIFKLALQNIPPFTLAYIRFLGAALILLPFSLKKLEIKKEDLGDLFLLSFFGITLNITFFFWGLKRAPSINAPIIASSGPVFVYLSSIIFLREKPHKRIIIGLILSLLGVLTIVGQPIIENGFNISVLGNIFFVFATIGAVGHIIFTKKIISRYSAITIAFWSFVIGAFTFLPFVCYELITADPLSAIDYRGWTGLIFGIVFSYTLGYLIF
jgi:drug/metabolite transporter (DMT)-like permease